MGSLVDYFMEFHDVFVPQFGQGINLTMNSVLSLHLLQILLLIGFDCNNCLRFFVYGTSHHGESALTNFEANLKLFEVQGLLIALIFSKFISPRLDNFSEVVDSVLISLIINALRCVCSIDLAQI